MATFYVTFGQQYPRERHPTFDDAHRDGWVEVDADTYAEARALTVRQLGVHWSDIYTAPDWDPSYYPLGVLGVLTASGWVP